MVVIVTYIVLMCIAVAVCVTLGRHIASGKADGLIAGYGAASKQEQEKYDIERLRRVTSISLYFVAGILPLFSIVAFLPEDSAMTVTLLLTVITITILTCGVVWGDKWSRRK